jgi:hypothetical protein
VVAGESGEVGNPGTLGMTKGEGRCRERAVAEGQGDCEKTGGRWGWERLFPLATRPFLAITLSFLSSRVVMGLPPTYEDENVSVQ